MNRRRLPARLAGDVVHHVRLNDMANLVEGFGFAQTRVSGGHHIFTHPHLSELVNLQNVGGQAKPYQYGGSCGSSSGII